MRWVMVGRGYVAVAFKRFAKTKGTTCGRENWSVDCVMILHTIVLTENRGNHISFHGYCLFSKDVGGPLFFCASDVRAIL